MVIHMVHFVAFTLLWSIGDYQLFHAAISASSDSAKLAGLNRLIATYPQSKLRECEHRIQAFSCLYAGTARTSLQRTITLPQKIHRVCRSAPKYREDGLMAWNCNRRPTACCCVRARKPARIGQNPFAIRVPLRTIWPPHDN